MPRPYMKTDYRDLSAYEGKEVRIIKWLWAFDYREPPAQAFIAKDYERTVLFDLVYTACEWGVQMPPRHILKMVPKSAMACGDVIVREAETGRRLVGSEISNYKEQKKAEEAAEELWQAIQTI